jgi:hypothetical protein
MSPVHSACINSFTLGRGTRVPPVKSFSMVCRYGFHGDTCQNPIRTNLDLGLELGLVFDVDLDLGLGLGYAGGSGPKPGVGTGSRRRP